MDINHLKNQKAKTTKQTDKESLQSLPLIFIYGGQSLEHDAAIEGALYLEPYLKKITKNLGFVYIDINGRWHYKLSPQDKNSLDQSQIYNKSTLQPGENLLNFIKFVSDDQNLKRQDICIFPFVHSTTGEDGQIQGFLRLCRFNFIGSDILGSCLALDKFLCKEICSLNKTIPVGKYCLISSDKLGEYSSTQNKLTENYYKKITQNLETSEIFIKPNNLGSSIGVGISKNFHDFKKAINNAVQYDYEIICEPYYHDKRELECSILESNFGTLKTSLIGEVGSSNKILTYDDKYKHSADDSVKIVNDLSSSFLTDLQNKSISVFKALNLNSLARIDWFYVKTNNSDDISKKLVLNEVNSLPGMSNISHYLNIFESTIDTYEILLVLIQRAFDYGQKRHDFMQTIPHNFKKYSLNQ